ncbi:hypothetical protein MCOR27_001868 [Pyricularia oryzae]|uniref:Uncharacterized protein n=2 Tax=Pyricularia TaxID=48558 RepID=A0ABQ8NVJ5_PYRGI|nr:hypothetical protein MCOR01_001147 [Pyricularia oryzae]KAI6302479.1 hypothetical protein MCOR33_002221 [Pyricularia grisea]KAH9430324.1 hypothetical protein MCOR02_010036 [Pyricularia oryzae]KAI6268707.1 hypothetical protein MCOR26_009063 [Pyricularia oryzae]KAI6286268.1 hypothetical protein MCOR27_001868 [Pyricularia oryzae]
MPAIGDADHRPGNSTTHIFAHQQAPPPTPKVTVETVADGYSSGVDQGGDIDTGAIAGIALSSSLDYKGVDIAGTDLSRDMASPRAQSVPPGRSVAPRRPHAPVSHPLGMYTDSTAFPRATQDQQSNWEWPRPGRTRESGRLVRRNVGKPQYHRAQYSSSTLGDQTPSSLRSCSPVSLRENTSSPETEPFSPASARDTERYLVWMPTMYGKNVRYSWMVMDEIGQRPQREPRSPLEEWEEQLQHFKALDSVNNTDISVEPSPRDSEEACGVRSMPSVLKPARGRPILSKTNAQSDKTAGVPPSFRMPSKPYMVFLTGQTLVGDIEIRPLSIKSVSGNRAAGAERTTESDTTQEAGEGSPHAVRCESEGPAASSRPKIRTDTSIPTAADFSPSKFDYGASPTILEYYYKTVFAAVEGKEGGDNSTPDVTPNKAPAAIESAQQEAVLQKRLEDCKVLPLATVPQSGNVEIKTH